MSRSKDDLLQLTPEISENLSHLRQLRGNMGLTLKGLGRILGITDSALSQYERGVQLPQPCNYNKLAEIFGWKKVALSYSQRLKENTFRAKKVEDLEQGRHYKIFSGNSKTTDNPTSSAWINSIIFEYVGKRGIHHCFKSVLGGWSRTYTEYQLVDKKILEVSINGVSNNTGI